jgi:hypothetical protein
MHHRYHHHWTDILACPFLPTLSQPTTVLPQPTNQPTNNQTTQHSIQPKLKVKKGYILNLTHQPPSKREKKTINARPMKNKLQRQRQCEKNKRRSVIKKVKKQKQTHKTNCFQHMSFHFIFSAHHVLLAVSIHLRPTSSCLI